MKHFLTLATIRLLKTFALSMQNKESNRESSSLLAVQLVPRDEQVIIAFAAVCEFCSGAGASFSSPGFTTPTVSPLLFPASPARE